MLELKCQNCETGILTLHIYTNYTGDLNYKHLTKKFMDFDVDSTCKCIQDYDILSGYADDYYNDK